MNQPMKILIAYDGSSRGDAVLTDLQKAGLPNDAEAIVISVADVCLWPISTQESESTIPEPASVKKAHQKALQAVEEARALAIQASDRLRTRFPGWKIAAEGHGESPAWAIIQKAEQWKPDLVVVGSHGRSALGKLVLGSVSQKVITETRCSVRVARASAEQGKSQVRIVLGVDGSAGAEAAVRAIAGRLWPSGSEVRLVAALDPMMATSLEWIESGTTNERTWMSKRLENAVEKLSASGLSATTVIGKGDPKRLLLREAKQWGADCIFVGATGLRGIGRLLLGSVSAAIVARAACSVEVVRDGE